MQTQTLSFQSLDFQTWLENWDGSWWQGPPSGSYTEGSLGHWAGKKAGGKSGKMTVSKLASSEWRSRILQVVQKSDEAHYWVTGHEKDVSLFF